jgi:2-deoxy-D-gluconate 3-dehydrogenase
MDSSIISMKLYLQGKVVLITGAGTGLGKAMALELARAGADIVTAARRVELIEETAKEVKLLGRRSIAIPVDITDSSQVNFMVERTMSEMGNIDILINNAGIVRGEKRKPIWEISDDEWHLGLDTNLSGAFYCCRATAKHMKERKSGKIINISSGGGLRGQRNGYTYEIPKCAIIQLTRSLALSLSEDNIQVNCIVPGLFDTANWKPKFELSSMVRRLEFQPMRRAGNPTEMGKLAVFLASCASDYLTGGLFIYDGAALAGGYAPTGFTYKSL